MAIPKITVHSEDARRLAQLIEEASAGREPELLERHDAEVARALVVRPEELPADIVTMNSTVEYVDVDTGEKREVTLVYPERADVNAGRLSVLTPMGTALLGLSVGQTITWPLPRGREKKIKVVAVRQPPLVGDGKDSDGDGS